MVEAIDPKNHPITSNPIHTLFADMVTINRQIGRFFNSAGEGVILSADEGGFLEELHAQKSYFMLQLLEARASGLVDIPVYVFQFAEEQFHRWSRNNIAVDLPDPMVEGQVYRVRGNVGELAAARDTNSLAIIELIKRGKPNFTEEDLPNNYLVRTFYEIQAISSVIKGAQLQQDYKEATRLQQVKTALAIRVLQLRDNRRKGVDPKPTIPIRVGLLNYPKLPPGGLVQVGLKLEYSSDRGYTDHSFTIPPPSNQKMEFRQTLRRLIMPYDYINSDR